MSSATKKEVLVEYPINIVYDTLHSIFPVKYYNLKRCSPFTYSFTVIDSFNRTFIMKINLIENTDNTTIISFKADYRHAIMDLTKGGQQAIDIILEELLIQLDKQVKTGIHEAQDSDIEVVNADTFVNITKNKSHTPSIVIGYVLCIISVVLPLYSLINYDPEDIIMFTFFIVGILSLTSEISLSIILQYYEDQKSKFHGRIQICLCGLSLILLGLLVHPSLAVAGILIPIIVLTYLIKREKSVN